MKAIDGYEINILDRTKKFAVSIILLSSKFPRNTVSFVLVDQLIRAASSIGANLVEAQEASSSKDFIYKISISLKEAKETKYWIELILLSKVYESDEIHSLLIECEEIVRILVATLKKLKQKQNC